MNIQEIEIKYGTDSNYITLHAVKEMDDFTVTIKDACMLITDNTSNDVKLVIDGFVNLVKVRQTKSKAEPEQKTIAKPKAVVKPKTEKKPKADKRPRHIWTADEKSEAMRMYQEGVPAAEIALKFGSTYDMILNIAKRTGTRRPWKTRGNDGTGMTRPSSKPVKTQAEIEAEEKERKQQLKDYKQNHKQPWYLN
jgi:hypothetical protein